MKHKVKWLFGFIFLSFAMAISAVFIGNLGKGNDNASIVSATTEEEKITVVIDAGHGGEDGGCSGLDGTLEKDLNLSVAKNVYDILKAAGVSVAMTRNEDTMLYDMYGDLEDYSGAKKTYDLKNRVRFAKETEAELFVSIHMNKFAVSQYSGLQVYYSDNDSDSITAATRIQSSVRENLQTENEREIKKAGSNIYVLYRSQLPAVLVECGFLSNTTDLENMKDESYRKKLSLCISAGIIDALEEFQT